MHSFSIPTCYFPSTVLFVDDNRDFLLNFVLQLDENLAYRIFDNPKRGLDYLHNKNCGLDILSQHGQTHESGTNYWRGQHNASFDLSAIHAEVYNPYRFSEISVVVVDYAMPGIDGLEFCRMIENNNIKKILLTGQADEKLAIQAFNEGVIHRYIKKSDADAADLITRSIAELQWQYFQGMSDMIAHMLPSQFPPCLHDKKFAQFFRELRLENHICEYYLTDDAGGFFMLNEDARPSLLVVRGAEDMKSFCERVNTRDLSHDLLEQLDKGLVVPQFWPSSPGKEKETVTQNHFLPAKRIVGSQTYYYAHLPYDEWYVERPQKILSYNRYLEELDAEELLMD